MSEEFVLRLFVYLAFIVAINAWLVAVAVTNTDWARGVAKFVLFAEVNVFFVGCWAMWPR